LAGKPIKGLAVDPSSGRGPDKGCCGKFLLIGFVWSLYAKFISFLVIRRYSVALWKVRFARGFFTFPDGAFWAPVLAMRAVGGGGVARRIAVNLIFDRLLAMRRP
jgi:hypothetical protein